jgi:hypothetical protein
VFPYFLSVTKRNRPQRTNWRAGTTKRGTTMTIKLLKIAAAIALAVFVVGFKPNPANSTTPPAAGSCPRH